MYPGEAPGTCRSQHARPSQARPGQVRPAPTICSISSSVNSTAAMRTSDLGCSTRAVLHGWLLSSRAYLTCRGGGGGGGGGRWGGARVCGGRWRRGGRAQQHEIRFCLGPCGVCCMLYGMPCADHGAALMRAGCWLVVPHCTAPGCMSVPQHWPPAGGAPAV